MSRKWLIRVELIDSPHYLVLRQGGENPAFLPYVMMSTPKKSLMILVDEAMWNEMQTHIPRVITYASPDDHLEKVVSLHASFCISEKCTLKPLFQGYRIGAVTAREISQSPFTFVYLASLHAERFKLVEEMPHVLAILPPRRVSNDYFIVIAEEDIEEKLSSAGLLYQKISVADL